MKTKFLENDTYSNNEIENDSTTYENLEFITVVQEI